MASYLRSAAAGASDFVFKQFGGHFLPDEPSEMEEKLSPAAKALFNDVYKDLDCSRIIDYHVHLLGQDTEKTGCYCHPSLLDGNNLLERFKANCFLTAAKVTRGEPDEAYVDRLKSLCTSSCPRAAVEKDGSHMLMCGLALDYAHLKTGEASAALTTLHVPNDYSFDVAVQHSDAFIPTCSVHPYRTDAVQELQRCRSRGVRLIKWLPNSQAIDPSDGRCNDFYDTVRELDMILLSHTGDEHSLTAGSCDNTVGNPLHLKWPLDKGCKVIMAHCATEGYFNDLEDPELKRVSGVDLMLRLMTRAEYDDLLYADISAIIGTLRAKHLKTLLEHEEIHHRLVYGSDYPVPAINVVSSTKQLWMLGLISWEDGKALNEIYRYNPLTYDLAVKRRLSYNGHRFPASIFQEHPKLVVSDWQHASKAQ